MSVLVTGTPGSGKTSLVSFAEGKEDIRFFDADQIPGLCEWREFTTRKTIGLVDDIGIKSEDDWHRQYGWYWRVPALEQFLKENPDSVICGSSENVTDCYRLFDRIFILRKTEEDLLHNLQSPDRQNPFGKTAEQRAGFMKWQDHLIKESQPFNHSYIDGIDTSVAYDSIVGQL